MNRPPAFRRTGHKFLKMADRLERNDWITRRTAHAASVRPWVKDRVERSQNGIKHPVFDFLFEYYPFRPAHLARWSPGFGVVCGGMTVDQCDWPEWFEPCKTGMILQANHFKSHRRQYLDWACTFLHTTIEREPTFHCFGLHEWAMIYRTNEVRHSMTPLRLSRTEIDTIVESMPLRCTHYDAFRFFTPAAAPLNRFPLARLTTADQDQSGCIHANMDLYKYAFAVAPFLSAELTTDCFELAIAAREVDMRASPYDLRSFGFEPIRIETREGRDEYVSKQREIAERAMPLRVKLLTQYRALRQAIAVTAENSS